MKIARYFSSFALLAVLVGCSNAERGPDLTKDASAAAFVEAADRVKELKEAGALPGCSKEDHGVISSHRMRTGTKITYPVVVSMQVEKTANEDSIYWFVLRKTAESARFEIVEAWRTDFKGENRQTLLEKGDNAIDK